MCTRCRATTPDHFCSACGTTASAAVDVLGPPTRGDAHKGWVFIGGRKELTTLVAVISVLALAGCGGQQLTAGGKGISNASDALTNAERDWRAELAKGSVTVSKDARCYYAVLKDKSDIGKNIMCGPVRHFGSDGTKPWETVEAKTSPAGEDKVSVASDDSFSAGTIPPGYVLQRPDGQEAPENLTLAEPPAPSSESAFSAWLTESPSLKDARSPASGKGIVITPTFTAEITSVGSLAEIGTGSERKSAPKGERFVAAKVTFSSPPDSAEPKGDGFSSDKNAPTDLVAQLRFGDKTQEIVTPAISPAEGAVTLVAAVPVGAADIVLELTSGGLTQGLSLSTGERVSTVAQAYYDGAKSSVPIAAGVYGESSKVMGDLEVTYTVQFTHAWRSPFSTRLGWAPAGQVYVTVPLEEFRADTTKYSYSLKGSSDVLSLSDSSGKKYADKFAGTDYDYAVFVVPETQKKFNFTVKGGGTFTSPSGFYKPASGVFELGAKTWPIDFAG